MSGRVVGERRPACVEVGWDRTLVHEVSDEPLASPTGAEVRGRGRGVRRLPPRSARSRGPLPVHAAAHHARARGRRARRRRRAAGHHVPLGDRVGTMHRDACGACPSCRARRDVALRGRGVGARHPRRRRLRAPPRRPGERALSRARGPLRGRGRGHALHLRHGVPRSHHARRARAPASACSSRAPTAAWARPPCRSRRGSAPRSSRWCATSATARSSRRSARSAWSSIAGGGFHKQPAVRARRRRARHRGRADVQRRAALAADRRAPGRRRQHRAREGVQLNLGYVITHGLSILGGSGATRRDMAELFALHAERPFAIADRSRAAARPRRGGAAARRRRRAARGASCWCPDQNTSGMMRSPHPLAVSIPVRRRTSCGSGARRGRSDRRAGWSGRRRRSTGGSCRTSPAGSRRATGVISGT